MTEKNELKNNFNSINQFFQYFLNFPLLGLSCIITISLLFRFSYFDSEISLTNDALEYFFYALDTSMLGHLPGNYSLENNGWPVFLSVFFSFFEFNEGISYVQLQRILSVILSTSIVVPVYLLCRKFTDKPVSLIASAIFAFEPRIISNSLFGLTEPLYILLCSISLVFFLSDNKKLVYSSFALVSFATLVRSEAIFLFIGLSVMFFIKFRHDKFVLPKYVPALLIFVLLLLPMSLYRIDVIGNDGIVGRVVDGVERTQNGATQGIFIGLENYFKFLGWDLIPLFLFFAPIGFFLILKNLNYQKITILITTLIMSLPAIYAYSVPALDTRFLFILYPMFCIFSALTITKFVNKFSSKNKNSLLILILVITLSLSIIFIEYKIIDTDHDKVKLIVAKYLVESPKVIAGHYPHGYLESTQIFENWDKTKSYFFMDREKGLSVRSIIPHDFTIISTDRFDNIEDFIQENKKNGLSVLVIDKNEIHPKFLSDIFENEEKYPYLIKKLDTSDLMYSYHVKIFEIDYIKFLEN
jgi:hypothetical protein